MTIQDREEKKKSFHMRKIKSFTWFWLDNMWMMWFKVFSIVTPSLFHGVYYMLSKEIERNREKSKTFLTTNWLTATSIRADSIKFNRKNPPKNGYNTYIRHVLEIRAKFFFLFFLYSMKHSISLLCSVSVPNRQKWTNERTSRRKRAQESL